MSDRRGMGGKRYCSLTTTVSFGYRMSRLCSPSSTHPSLFVERFTGENTTNPILAVHPDPSICKVERTIILLIPHSPTSRDYRFPQQDLVHWELIGHVPTGRISTSTSKASRGLYAPTIRYNKGLSRGLRSSTSAAIRGHSKTPRRPRPNQSGCLSRRNRSVAFSTRRGRRI
jgi:hypothetical protein